MSTERKNIRSPIEKDSYGLTALIMAKFFVGPDSVLSKQRGNFVPKQPDIVIMPVCML
jgi:hypothetical protein